MHVDFSRLRRTSWKQYLVRFVFGGVVTAAVGGVAHFYGPAVGGLFLAFPAILPAALTLIKTHGGREEAQQAAVGAAIGSLGLVVFGVAVATLATHPAPWQVLILALLAWLLTAVGVWRLLLFVRQRRQRAGARARG